jgi:hypothetical protein
VVPSGNEIFYCSTDGRRIIAVTVRPSPEFTIARPRVLFQGAFRTGLFWSIYDVSRRLTSSSCWPLTKAATPQLTVAVNWARP